jgi:putative acetyltransferase
MPLTATQEQPDTDDVHALLLRHFDLMSSQSAEESCHVMAPETLMEAGATLFGIREEDRLLGVGALAVIAPGHGELKSMHTAAEARGKGVARRLMEALLDHARAQGLTRVSLETGSTPEFLPARTLYEAFGFTLCPPFGSYIEDPLSVFMTKELTGSNGLAN